MSDAGGRLVLPICRNPLSKVNCSTPIDEQAWRVGADVRFGNDDGLSLRLNYVGESGDKIESHTGGVNVRLKF